MLLYAFFVNLNNIMNIVEEAMIPYYGQISKFQAE